MLSAIVIVGPETRENEESSALIGEPSADFSPAVEQLLPGNPSGMRGRTGQVRSRMFD